MLVVQSNIFPRMVSWKAGKVTLVSRLAGTLDGMSENECFLSTPWPLLVILLEHCEICGLFHRW